jgi:hypothetical protein
MVNFSLIKQMKISWPTGAAKNLLKTKRDNKMGTTKR